MRRSLLYLFPALVLVACSDNTPTTLPQATSLNTSIAKSRVAAIDQMISDFFPTGLETATGNRWDHIDLELGTWNGTSWTGASAAQGIKHTMDLIKFVQLKTNDIVQKMIGTELKQHAAARLIAAMITYVTSGPGIDPPSAGADVAFAFVPAGATKTIVTPSGHAGVFIPLGSTNEDRYILVAQNEAAEAAYEGCNGPLVYSGCQFPHFYRFESLPLLRLNSPGQFAVCHTPLAEGGDSQIRLAHDLPANAADYTPGATQLQGGGDNIEILPLVGAQGLLRDVMTCSLDSEVGSIGLGKRMLYALNKLASKIFSPKPLYAYDQGPEHFSIFFSNFNGVFPPSDVE